MLLVFLPSRDSDDIHFIQIQFDRAENPVNIACDAFSFEVLRGVYYTRRQFHLMLAFAITIHKGQGLSLKSAVVDAGPESKQKLLAVLTITKITQS